MAMGPSPFPQAAQRHGSWDRIHRQACIETTNQISKVAEPASCTAERAKLPLSLLRGCHSGMCCPCKAGTLENPHGPLKEAGPIPKLK